MKLWLDPIPEIFRPQAVGCIESGDAGFLCFADNQQGLELVWRNFEVLKAKGLYEKALLEAFERPRVNTFHWQLDALRCLFRLADRDLLRAAGDPLPGPGPFTVYRGVSGRGAARRVRGLSWTGSLEKARWFANRYVDAGLADPAVFQVTVNADAVLAYTDGRNEREFIVLLPDSAKPRRVRE